MACRGFWECLLKLLNLLLTLVGLAMIGYGIYLFVEYQNADDTDTVSPVSHDRDIVQLGRPMLMAVSLADSFLDKLPKAWFIYVFIGVGIVLFVISCFGCIGVATRNGCCLASYAVLVILLILVELGCAAFIFFDKSWREEIPTDKTGDFNMIYSFLKEHWTIVKWVALVVVVLENINFLFSEFEFSVDSYRPTIELCLGMARIGNVNPVVLLLALIFLLALVVRSANRPVEYDSDDEFIASRQQIRQPLLNRPPPSATGLPVTSTLDQRPSRNDAWSTRMREKYGLDTSEFTYNPSESHRFQQGATQQNEERSRCTIM